jgi:hypothetical protein
MNMLKSRKRNVLSIRDFLFSRLKAGKPWLSKYQDLITSFALIAVFLLIGLVIVRDYGPSWDEMLIQKYSQQSLAAYGNFLRTGSLPDFGEGDLKYYGPAYMMVCELIARTLNSIGIGWSVSQWHIAIFLSFLLSVLSIYFLARRWLKWWSALGITLLFATQPLLWGHAFINPKDTPFMAFFLITVTVGFEMIDRSVLMREPLPTPVFRGILRSFYRPPVLLAAFSLGFTTSIRVLGPYAGLIVVLYGLIRSWKGLLKVLPAYFTIALAVSFLTWPYLWKNPLLNFIQSVRIMSDFPWNGLVLFRGAVLHPAELPRYFYPLLMSLQLTEPLVILSIVGFLLSIYIMIAARKFEPFSLVVVWFLGPLFAAIYLSHTWYDNFRQLLFLLPPVFLSAGLVLDQAFKYIKPVLVRIVILAVLVAPGIYSSVKLHPFEYVYFNSFNGGVNGASRNYELDYWATSYRQAAFYLNLAAPLDARIIVVGAEHIFGGFARPDLKVISETEIDGDVAYDYAVISTADNEDEYICVSGEEIYAIMVDNIPLTVIKSLDQPGQCP